MIALRSPRLRAVLVSVAVVFAPLGIARAFHPWIAVDEATLLALPIAIVLGAWLGWRVVRPLEKLERQVSAKADLKADLSLDRGDEYARLTQAMNALLARLEAKQRAHEDFVADLVHALKSPVAATRVVAERLLEGGLDEARARRLGAALEASAGRLDGITRALLDLARAEAGLTGEGRARVELGALVRARVELARRDGRFPGCSVELGPLEPAIAELVESRVASAVDALLDNARSYGRVARASVVGGAIVVEDDGPGVPEGDRARLFTRFFTTRSGEGGTGLGLAWARAVAEAHGGSANLEGRSRFVLRFPLTEGAS